MEYDEVIGCCPCHEPESSAALMCAGEKLRAFGVIAGTDLKTNGIMWIDAKIIGTVLTGSGRRAADTRLSNPTRKHRACWGSMSKEPGLPPTGIDGKGDRICEDGENKPWDYIQHLSSEERICKHKKEESWEQYLLRCDRAKMDRTAHNPNSD